MSTPSINNMALCHSTLENNSELSKHQTSVQPGNQIQIVTSNFLYMKGKILKIMSNEEIEENYENQSDICLDWFVQIKVKTIDAPFLFNLPLQAAWLVYDGKEAPNLLDILTDALPGQIFKEIYPFVSGVSDISVSEEDLSNCHLKELAKMDNIRKVVKKHLLFDLDNQAELVYWQMNKAEMDISQSRATVSELEEILSLQEGHQKKLTDIISDIEDVESEMQEVVIQKLKLAKSTFEENCKDTTHIIISFLEQHPESVRYYKKTVVEKDELKNQNDETENETSMTCDSFEGELQLREILNKKESQLRALTTENSKLQAKVQEERKVIEGLRKVIIQIQQDKTKFQEEKSTFLQNKEDLQKKIDELQNQSSELFKEVEDLKKASDPESLNQFQFLQQTIKTKDTELALQEKLAKEAEEKNLKLFEENLYLNLQLSQTQLEHRTEMTKLQRTLTTTDQEKQRLHSERTMLNDKIAILNGEISQVHHGSVEIDNLKTQLAEKSSLLIEKIRIEVELNQELLANQTELINIKRQKAKVDQELKQVRQMNLLLQSGNQGVQRPAEAPSQVTIDHFSEEVNRATTQLIKTPLEVSAMTKKQLIELKKNNLSSYKEMKKTLLEAHKRLEQSLRTQEVDLLMINIENALSNLRHTESAIEKEIEDKKISAIDNDETVTSNLSAPEFHGPIFPYHYYEWIEMFNDYLDSVNLTKTESAPIWRNSLRGEAASIADTYLSNEYLPSTHSIMNLMKEHFGNPDTILDNILQAIESLSTTTHNPAEKDLTLRGLINKVVTLRKHHPGYMNTWTLGRVVSAFQRAVSFSTAKKLTAIQKEKKYDTEFDILIWMLSEIDCQIKTDNNIRHSNKSDEMKKTVKAIEYDQ